jgi:hypothetical protein
VHHTAGRRFIRRNEIGDALAQRARQMRIVDDVAERRHTGIGGIQPCLSEGATLRDVNGVDRRGGETLPGAEPFEDQATGVRQRDRAERSRRVGALHDPDF